ncbi:MAG: glycosyltransferase family 1 protein [Chloroflexota bacterium]|jgi:glycosyltransferase involved in cell wall biosynthesis|nr:glycosyltransferase family 1 protein [Chloroflexota bacterium]
MRSAARALSANSGGHHIDLIVDREPTLPLPADAAADIRIVPPFPFGNRALQLLVGGDPWYRLRLPLDSRWRRLDAYVCNAHEEPPVIDGPPRVPIVHDLAFMLDEAERFFTREMIAHLDRCTAANVHAAAKVVAVSHTTARDVERFYGVPTSEIEVLHNAHDAEMFRLDIDGKAVEATKRELGLAAPFFLHVGTIQPRKNLAVVLEGFERLRKGGDERELLLVGVAGWSGEEESSRGLPDPEALDGVRLLGGLPTEQVAHLMKAAEALIMAGFYEGFGLPALEAMACGTPVLAAEAGALPEVVGDVGLLFDPNDPAELAGLMRRVGEEPGLRERLGAEATALASEFSWESHARGLVAIAESLAGR